MVAFNIDLPCGFKTIPLKDFLLVRHIESSMIVLLFSVLGHLYKTKDKYLKTNMQLKIWQRELKIAFIDSTFCSVSVTEICCNFFLASHRYFYVKQKGEKVKEKTNLISHQKIGYQLWGIQSVGKYESGAKKVLRHSSKSW